MTRLDVARLKDEATCMALQEQLDEALADAVMDEWPQFKSAVYNSEAKVIGFNKPRHHDLSLIHI